MGILTETRLKDTQQDVDSTVSILYCQAAA